MKKNKFAIGQILPYFVLAAVMHFSCMEVKASGNVWYHVHSDSCYETVSELCTLTHAKVGTDTKIVDNYCSTCGKEVWSWEFTYALTCPSGASGYGGSAGSCGVCKSVLFNNDVNSLEGHTINVTRLKCTKTADTVIGSVEFHASTTEQTQEPVILSISVNMQDSEFQPDAAPYSLDGGNSWGTNASLSVTENGSYSLAFRDASGRVCSQSFDVANIIKPEPPKEVVNPDPFSATGQNSNGSLSGTETTNVPVMEETKQETAIETEAEEAKIKRKNNSNNKEKDEKEKSKLSISGTPFQAPRNKKSVIWPMETDGNAVYEVIGVSWSACKTKNSVSLLKNPMSDTLSDDNEEEDTKINEETTDESSSETSGRVIYKLNPTWPGMALAVGGLLIVSIAVFLGIKHFAP